MISNQILQNTIDGMTSIAHVELCVADRDGRSVVCTMKEKKNFEKAIQDFVNSSAESQEVQNCQFFKIFDEQQLEYILIVSGASENAYLVGKMAAFQIQSLLVAYKERFDKDNFIKNLLLDNLLLVDIYSRAKKLHMQIDMKRVVLIVETASGKDSNTQEMVKECLGVGNAREIVTAVDENNVVIVKELPDEAAVKEVDKVAHNIVAFLTKEGLDEKLLLRSDGTSVYMTQDIGTAKLRFQDYPIDKMIYVVGNEQNYHFQVLSILLDKLGFKWGKDLVHFSYGMVELPNGKMKSREGTVVDADDLRAAMIADARQMSNETGKNDDMTEAEKQETARIVGMGALKYFILKVDARKNMLFNPEESIDFNGNTGPFIQYTYARIRSIIRRAEEQGLQLTVPAAGAVELNEKEISLIQKIAEYPAAVAQAGMDYSPSGIANYCYELTKAFNQFYHDYSVLSADTPDQKQLRLAISANVAKTIKNGMALLGIEVPERM